MTTLRCTSDASGPRHPHALVILAAYAALSIVWTWPLATEITSRVASDPGDPFLNTWILWWNAQAVPFTERWWNPPIFYPMPGALALSEHLAGIGFFTTPLLLAGATPALAYNTALLLSYTLSGFFTYLLVRRLTGSPPAAFCAGLAYAFAPFRAGQLGHLQVLTSQWLALQLVGLHSYTETGRRRWLCVFGVGWILQALSNGYYLLFAPVLLVLWMCWFVVARRHWRSAMHIAAAWVLASIALLPSVLEYREVHGGLGLARVRTEIVRFSATWESFLKPPHMLAAWPPRDVPAIEDYLFPGITMVTIVLAGVVAMLRQRRGFDGKTASALLFYVLAGLFMAALAMGPASPDAGPTGWLRPYEWLVHLPGFSGLRVPARFGMLMALCLAVAGGLAMHMVLPAARWRRALVTAAVIGGISLDGFMEPVPTSTPPRRIDVSAVPGATVLELPPDDTVVTVGAMMRAMSHGRPLINGYSGYIPPHYAILSHSLRRGDPSAVIELARGRTLLIIISERRDRTGHFRRVIESIPGVERGDTSTADDWYVLRAQPRDRRPPHGTPLRFTAVKQPRSHVVLDLGAVQVVRSVEFALGHHWRTFGRRFAIEASPDASNWQTVWDDWTGGMAISGALEDQRRVPVWLTLPDVTARYLRMHPAEDWLLETLTVAGP